LDPEDLRIKIKIAELYVKRKQIQDAIKIYMEVARSYADGGFYLKAVTVYKNILRLNPSLIDVNISLSELYEKMGLVQDALYQYQIVVSAYEQKNDTNGILTIREKMAGLDPQNTNLKIRLAETFQLQGTPEKAIDIYEQLAEKLKDKGSPEQMIELYNKILAHRPEKHEMIRSLCQIHYRRGEWKEVLRKMDIAKTFAEDDPEMLSMQADVYAKLNQIETAKKKYRDLADLYKEKSDVFNALKAYENILFLSPEDEEEVAKEVEELDPGSFNQIKASVAQKRAKIVEEDSKKAEEAKKAEEISHDTADAAKKLGLKPDEASLTADGSKAFEKQAHSSYDLGAMYKKMGLIEEAKAEFIKALRAYQRLIAGGFGNTSIITKTRELEEYLGHVKPATQAKPIEVKEKPKTVKKEKKEEPKKDLSSAKKKISFV
jgi:tetratricopeptide (TPR) repeat protein